MCVLLVFIGGGWVKLGTKTGATFRFGGFFGGVTGYQTN
jgi:hypothetical protein